MIFVDHVLIFSTGSRQDAKTGKKILSLFSKATGMVINEGKSSLTTNLLTEEELGAFRQHFAFLEKKLEEGLKDLVLC
jgi:hypothetical protein